MRAAATGPVAVKRSPAASDPSTASRSLYGPILAILLGLLAFFILVGPQVLEITNLAWLQPGDRAMHQLGWMFFRDTPWGVPPGSSPRLGLELANSIALVDGLPLFAIPFKLVASWLPQPFQYWGLWLLLSFVLQSLFAWRLARALGARSGLALVASGFALIAPVYLFRFPMHLALSGQWTLLLALWLYARPVAPRRWVWPLVGCLVAMIHAYLLAMVLAIWVADLARRRWAGSLGWSGVAAEIAVVLLPTALVLWAVGFFMTGSLGIGGYGVYRLNLLSFVIPFGWSRLVPPIPAGRGDYEGMAFLGIGILALLLVAVAVASGALPRLRRLASHRWLPLLLVVVLMFFYALSDRIAVGGVELLTLRFPSVFLHLAADFRSSGRFVWPAVYLLTVGAVVALGWRLRPRFALGIAVLALAAQFVDAAPSELRFHRTLPARSAVWSTPLASPFWDRAAAAGFTRVRAIPYDGIFGDWRALSYFAVTHGMATDAAYLGRTDGPAEHALAAREAGELATGTLEAGTLYELDHAATLAAAARLRPGDLLAWIDGRFIFARDGAALLDGLNIWARYGAQPAAAAAH